MEVAVALAVIPATVVTQEPTAQVAVVVVEPIEITVLKVAVVELVYTALVVVDLQVAQFR
jgi:hypothetical protein